MTGKVLVTGGTGFVAGWAIVELLRQGWTVRTTIRSPARETVVRRGIASEVEAGGRLEFAVADLMQDDGWDVAVAGCSHVLHIASPLGREAPGDRDALVEPARGGTLRVLRAATAAGVERIVMTSAAATARVRGSTAISNETMWADPEDPLLDPYRRSKIFAERAAWAFMARNGGRTGLATILPGAVFGPLLPGGEQGSVWVVKSMLEGKPPRLLTLGLSVVDVRDLAAAHVSALTAPQAANERFLCTGHFMWMQQMAQQLRDGLVAAGFAGEAARIPLKTLPDWLVKPLSLAMPQLRMFRHDIGKRYEADNGKAARMLGFAPRPAAETLTDCARSLIAERKAGRDSAA